jgi:hypothetical protein
MRLPATASVTFDPGLGGGLVLRGGAAVSAAAPPSQTPAPARRRVVEDRDRLGELVARARSEVFAVAIFVVAAANAGWARSRRWRTAPP